MTWWLPIALWVGIFTVEAVVACSIALVLYVRHGRVPAVAAAARLSQHIPR